MLNSFDVGEGSPLVGIAPTRFGSIFVGIDWSAPVIPQAPCVEMLFMWPLYLV